jgi:hypothetical protein
MPLPVKEFVGSFDFVTVQRFPNANERTDAIPYGFGKEKDGDNPSLTR